MNRVVAWFKDEMWMFYLWPFTVLIVVGCVVVVAMIAMALR